MTMISQDSRKSNTTLHARKKASKAMSNRLEMVGFQRRSERMSQCMERVQYAICANCGRVHITQAYLCRDRFCAICAAGLARKRWWLMMAAAEAADFWRGSRIAMLTLTIKNCSPMQLRQTLNGMALAFKRLQQRKFWKENIMGYARHTEITYNAEANTMHPHYHIMLVLAPNANKLGVIGSTIATDWRDALRVEYLPIYDIRYAYSSRNITVRDKNGETIADADNIKLISAFSQASKYMVKPTNILSIPDNNDMAAVVVAMTGLQTAAYGGCVRTARKIAAISDDDNLDAVAVDLRCCNADMIIATAHWALGEWINDITEEVAF